MERRSEMFHVKQLISEYIDLSEIQVNQFETFMNDVIEKNKVMNLTAITEEEMFHVKHYLDSLMLIKAVPDVSRETYKMIDIGTGAGFPGIPLAIAFPNLELTLMDSLEKRINFINEEIAKLGLKNVQAIHARAEDLARQEEHRERYDFAVSRAVANLSTLSEYSLPFVHIGGYFLPYKSEEIQAESEGAEHALEVLGGELKNIVKYSLPADCGERKILIIEKIKSTPHKYPRKAGKPSKEPL